MSKKLVVVYSGQGAQKQGMGQDLYQEFASVRKVFDTASQVLGYDMADLCFHQKEKLQQTKYTQPALLTVSWAISQLLSEQGVQPTCAAGLSLGEYTALIQAGGLSFQDGLSLVAKRGQLMEEAAKAHPGKMVAVLGGQASLIETVCQKVSRSGQLVRPANYNTIGQTVIGGHKEAVDEAVAELKAAGGGKMVPLKVSGAFHTPLMQSAAEAFLPSLQATKWQAFGLPIISNVTGDYYQADQAQDLLYQQIFSPVKWLQTIERLLADGYTDFIEVGSGKVLSGLIKKVDETVTTHHIVDCKTLNAFLAK